MEWLLENTQIHSTFASLGGFDGDCYVVSADCIGKHLEMQTMRDAKDTNGLFQKRYRRLTTSCPSRTTHCGPLDGRLGSARTSAKT